MGIAHYVESSAFHKDLDRYISFPSRSDAMIASLALSHKLGSALMDIIFLIIHDQSFDPSKMTLRKTEDIYAHLFKRSFAEASVTNSTSKIHPGRTIKNSETACPPTTHKSIPPIILYSVIAWIGESSYERDSHPSILKNLALVQRRYLRPARRVLGQSLYVNSGGRELLIKRCLANPSAGPWTRQLSLRISIPNNAVPTMNTIRYALTKRITGLHELSLAFNASVLSIDLLENTFSSLGSVSKLVLGLNRSLTDKRVSASHYRSIISMPSLKNLVLQNWDIPSMLDVPCERLPPWFSPLKPSPSFRVLHLFNPCFQFQGERFSEAVMHLFWMRDSHDNFSLNTLVLRFPQLLGPAKEKEKVNELCGCLLPLLHQVEVLYLAELPCDQEEDILCFFGHNSKALRKLFFQSENSPSEAALRSVPQTITYLSLQFGGYRILESSSQWEDTDARLHGLISNGIWPELNILNIYTSYDDMYRRQPLIPETFVKLSKTKALCKERGIRLSLTKLDGYTCFEEYESGILKGLKTWDSSDITRY